MKLDRAVSNTQWMDLFGSVKALTLPKTHSDHHPVCVRCLSPSKKNDERRFHFQQAWLAHENFLDLGGLDLMII